MIVKGVVLNQESVITPRKTLQIATSFPVGTEVLVYLDDKFNIVKTVKERDFDFDHPPARILEPRRVVVEDDDLGIDLDWDIDTE